MVAKADAPTWLDVALGRLEEPQPPAIDSDRMKELMRIALLTPAMMSPADIQEMAASVLTHLVRMRSLESSRPLS